MIRRLRMSANMGSRMTILPSRRRSPRAAPLSARTFDPGTTGSRLIGRLARDTT